MKLNLILHPLFQSAVLGGGSQGEKTVFPAGQGQQQVKVAVTVCKLLAMFEGYQITFLPQLIYYLGKIFWYMLQIV